MPQAQTVGNFVGNDCLEIELARANNTGIGPSIPVPAVVPVTPLMTRPDAAPDLLSMIVCVTLVPSASKALIV